MAAEHIEVVYGEDRPTSTNSFKCYFFIETPTGGTMSIDGNNSYMKRTWINRDENQFGTRRVNAYYTPSDRQFTLIMKLIKSSFGKSIKNTSVRIIPTPDGDELRIVGYGGFGLFNGFGKVVTPVEDIDPEVVISITKVGKGSTNVSNDGMIF